MPKHFAIIFIMPTHLAVFSLSLIRPVMNHIEQPLECLALFCRPDRRIFSAFGIFGIVISETLAQIHANHLIF